MIDIPDVAVESQETKKVIEADLSDGVGEGGPRG